MSKPVLPALILSAALLTAQDANSAATPAQPAPQSSQSQLSGGAVSLDAYHRDYEGPRSWQEERFDSNIWSAYNAKTSQSGNLEGTWLVSSSDGRRLVSLELRSSGSGRLEGAWRSLLAGYGLNDSGLVSDLSMSGRDIEINYYAGHSRSPTVLQLRKDGSGRWNGNMLDPLGHKTRIVMSAAVKGG